jgi:small-conductance mechanosensitive channel
VILLSVFDFGARLLEAVGHAFDVLLGFIPALIGAIVLIIIGWIVSGIVANLVRRLLDAVHFDQITERAGIDEMAERFDLPANGSELFAGLAKWFIRLIFLVAAFNALQIPAVTSILNAILLFLPSLLVALLILVIGSALARVARDAVQGATDNRFLGALAQYGIIALAVVIALEQIGVGVAIITIMFAAVMLALSLAAGLAFGLGGRDTAQRLVDGWYAQMQTTPPATGTRLNRAATTPPRVTPPVSPTDTSSVE